MKYKTIHIDWCFLSLIKYSSNDEDRLKLRKFIFKSFPFLFFFLLKDNKTKMTKLLSLCFILSFQFVYGNYGSSIFQQAENVVSNVLDVFGSNFTLIHKDYYENDLNGRDSIDQTNDTVCLLQFNSILSGLNNTEMWAIKSEFFLFILKNGIHVGSKTL